MTIENLLQTAKHFNVDRKTIRSTIAKYKNFPCRKNPDNGRTEFDWKKISDWIDEGNDWWRGERVQPDKEDLPDNIKRLRKEINSKDSKSAVQTKLLQLEYDKKRGVLVEREEIISRMIILISRVAKQMEMMPNLIGKKMGLPNETIELFRLHMDQAREALVNDSETAFSKDEMAGV
jgi:hypothetical protein